MTVPLPWWVFVLIIGFSSLQWIRNMVYLIELWYESSHPVGIPSIRGYHTSVITLAQAERWCEELSTRQDLTGSIIPTWSRSHG